MPALLDGREQRPDTAFAVRAGQVLRFGFPTAGARAYLAVAGGIDVPEVLGSRSTYALGALGGFQGATDGGRPAAGRRAQRQDRAGCKPAHGPASGPGGEVVLRVVPGLYFHRLTEAAAQSFFTEPGPSAPKRTASAIATKAAAPEFPATGTTVRCGVGPVEHRRQLLPDRLDPGAGRAGTDHPAPRCRVGGGYAMIGTVISADLDLIGQMQPNQQARFWR
jgi:allophanate hydrolase subunit 2